MAKGGSKVLTGIIAFILGFLFAVIVEIGVISIVINYALYADLDNLFKMTGVENKDEDGKYIYINTDEGNGGVKNAMQLLKKLQQFAGDYQNLTLGQIDEVLPVAESLVVQVRDALEEGTGISIDVEELKKVKYSELGKYFEELIRGLNVAPIVEKAMSAETIEKTPLLEILVYGKEADYVQAGDIASPVYYDVYRADAAGGYVREGDGISLDESLEGYLVSESAEDGETQTYRLYYYRYDTTVGEVALDWFVTDADYTFTAADPAAAVDCYYGDRDAATGTLTGNYYKENGERVTVDPVTVGDFMDDPTGLLYEVNVTELLGDNAGDLADEALEGISVGELVNGEVNFDEIIDSVKIASVIGEVKADDAIVAYLCYNVTGLVKQSDNLYSGIYHSQDENGERVKISCFAETDENGVIQTVYYGEADDRQTIVSASVKDVSERLGSATDDLAVADLTSVDASDAIMMYIAYGVTGLDGGTEIEKEGEAYTRFAAQYEGQNVYVKAKENEAGKYEVLGFYSDEECTVAASVDATSISGVSDKIGGITENLALSDVVDVNINDDSGNSVMSFLAFSVSDVKAGDDGVYTGVYHKQTDDGEVEISCFVETQEKNGERVITGVYYLEDGQKVWGEKTMIADVSAQVDRLTSTLKIKDLVSIDPDDKFMVKLGEYKINNISSAVDEFELGDFMDIDPESAIMIYIAYDLVDVKAAEGEGYTHVGKDAEGNTVYIASVYDEETEKYKVTGVYSDEQCAEPVSGVTVKEIPAQVDALTSRLKLVDIVDLNVNVENAVMMDVVYGVLRVEKVKVNGEHLTVEQNGRTLYVFKGKYGITEEYPEGSVCYIAARREENGSFMLEGFYTDETCTVELDVPATTIDGVSDRVESITDDLTLGELISDIDENRVLSGLKNSTINSLAHDIDHLALQSLYADEIYGEVGADGVMRATMKKAVETVTDESKEILFDSTYLYYVMNEDGSYTLVNNGRENAGKIESLGDGSTEYYTYGEPTGTWKFMLQSGGTEKVYTVNNIENLMVNATVNIGNAKLFDLARAGIIEMSSLYENYETEGTARPKMIGSVCVGDLTITGLIEAIENI